MSLDFLRGGLFKFGRAQLDIANLLVADEAAVEFVDVGFNRIKHFGVGRAGGESLRVGEDDGGQHRVSAVLSADDHAFVDFVN